MNAEAEAFPEVAPQSDGGSSGTSEEAPGTLAEDEQLSALRDKLAGTDSE
jgi:hypothetical protein